MSAGKIDNLLQKSKRKLRAACLDNAKDPKCQIENEAGATEQESVVRVYTEAKVLALSCIKLAYYEALKWYHKNPRALAFEDLVQAANLGFVKAAQKFREGLSKFSNYGLKSARNEIRNAFRAAGFIHIPDYMWKEMKEWKAAKLKLGYCADRSAIAEEVYRGRILAVDQEVNKISKLLHKANEDLKTNKKALSFHQNRISKKLARLRKLLENPQQLKISEDRAANIEAALECQSRKVFNMFSGFRNNNYDDSDVADGPAIIDTGLQEMEDAESTGLHLKQRLSVLSALEAEIIRMRNGFNGQVPKTQRDVAESLGISGQQVFYFESKAVRKLLGNDFKRADYKAINRN